MLKIGNDAVGLDQGDFVAFSDFEENGEMWMGTGPRERRRNVTFSEQFKAAPIVHVSLSMVDMDNASNIRADITAEDITVEGFTAIFKTWGDTKVARARIRWIAIGAVHHQGLWEV